MENDKDQNTLCCPNCGSTALSTDKKGFGTGKFVAGTLIAGPLAGVLAGGIGKNKREVYCLKCGRKYTPGSTFNGLVTVKQYNSRKKLEAKMKASGEDKEIIAYGCGTCCAIIAFIFFIIAISNKTTELMAFGGFLVILTIIFFVSAKNKKKARLEKEAVMKMQKQQAVAKVAEQERELKIKEKKSQMTTSCKKCGATVQGNMKFCSNCGSAVEIDRIFFCPRCDSEIQNESVKFCSNCGYDLSSPIIEPTPVSSVTSASISIEESSTYTTNTIKKEKIGCLTWVGAFYLPYFFIFSKHKKVKTFSLIWLALIIMIGVICSASQNDSKKEDRVASSPKQTTIKESPSKNISVADITLYHQLPNSVQAELKKIGISEQFGTELTRRRDLEDTNDMRCYRIRKCCALPKGCNDTVHIYMKRGSLYEVTYCGRTILGNGIEIHIKQAVVDFYYKYAKDKLYEINDLVHEGWTPSAYATGN